MKKTELFKDIKTIFLASGNAGKLREFKEAFKNQGITWKFIKDFTDFVEPEETGKTFLDNAIIKAKSAFEQTGFPGFADDSGLVIPEMGNYPGVRSARIGGDELDDKGRVDFLLKKMRTENIPENTPAYFASVLAFTQDGKTFLHTEGRVYGEIIFTPQGEEGFGYDPIFLLPERKITTAELSLEEKNKISHRGQAIKRLITGDINTLSL